MIKLIFTLSSGILALLGILVLLAQRLVNKEKELKELEEAEQKAKEREKKYAEIRKETRENSATWHTDNDDDNAAASLEFLQKCSKKGS